MGGNRKRKKSNRKIRNTYVFRVNWKKRFHSFKATCRQKNYQSDGTLTKTGGTGKKARTKEKISGGESRVREFIDVTRIFFLYLLQKCGSYIQPALDFIMSIISSAYKANQYILCIIWFVLLNSFVTVTRRRSLLHFFFTFSLFIQC